MASKRKSSIPCMVPAKTKTQREEFVVGCLPDFLPTIPEDRILNSFGEKEGERHKVPKPSCDRGIHSCPPCSFETTDMIFFLHHLDTCHINFQTQPLYCCLNCKLSLGSFEDLALHNARTHPQLHMEGSSAKSLQVTKKDGVLRVEQILFTEKNELSQSGVSITKTPIMKMVNGEQKDVSHMIGNGTAHKHVLPGTVPLPMQKIANADNIPAQNKRPIWNFTPRSSDSNSDLPKVMIPLSSIPTYDPAMDLSSFLKASFGKFPYPTKAELCYLTVVSGFPEEQIKLWFAAQRLKQGISWSPEEIEETRKKMFNTVFQATPRSLAKKSLHPVSGQCVAFQPSAVASGYIPQIMKSNVKKRLPSLKPQGNGQHGTSIKETEGFCLDTTDSVNQTNVDDSYTAREDKLCSSSGRTNHENHDGNINLRKYNCTVNNKQNSTSKPNTHFDTEYGDKHAACHTHFTSIKTNNGTVYSNTSLSITCTKKEGIVTANSKEAGECLPVPGVQASCLSDTPEELQALTQSIVHSSVLQDKTSPAFEDETVDTRSITEQFPGSTPGNEAAIQDNNNQTFNTLVTAEADESCPKAFPGISQVLAAELPLDDAIHYKEHEARCL